MTPEEDSNDICEWFKGYNLHADIMNLLANKDIKDVGEIILKCIPKNKSMSGKEEQYININIVIPKKKKDTDIELTIPEKIIVDYLRTVDYSSQSDISSNIDMAKSTVSKTLSSLLTKEAIRKNEFMDDFGDFRKKGKPVAHYIIDDEDS